MSPFPEVTSARAAEPRRPLVGRAAFTEAMIFELTGRHPGIAELRVADAALVLLAERRDTAASLAARRVLDGAPEAMQGAVAAGLLAAGSRSTDSIVGVARVLQVIAADARAIVGRNQASGGLIEAASGRIPHGSAPSSDSIPGIAIGSGNQVPAAVALLRVAAAEGVAKTHVAALNALAYAVEIRFGEPASPTIAGCVAAVFCDLGLHGDAMRGLTLVAECAGLVSHVVDERTRTARGA